MGIEGEDGGGAGEWGLQSPGRGSHPLGWRQVQYTFCSDGIRWAGISAKRMYNFCSHQKCHVAVYGVARIFCRKCTAWGQEQCGMGTHGNGEKKSGCCCASLHSTAMQLTH